MEQEIRFCKTSDGVRIAYATIGEGHPLVVVPGWVSHLEFEWNQPEARAFWESLARGRRLVRLDPRGTGLSDWEAADLSVAGRVRDVEAVIHALRAEHVDLFGLSHGGQTSALYATHYPERVSRLITYGSYPRLSVGPEVAEPLIGIVRSQWGMGSAALTSAIMPSANPADASAFTDLQRVATSGAVAAKTLEAIFGDDITESLKDVSVPTLVIHRRNDPVHPVDLGREIASLIPDARLDVLEGDLYPPWLGDSKAVLRKINAFLGGPDEIPEPAAGAASSALVTILFTDMVGSTALTQRFGDDKAQVAVRSHNAVVRDALKAHAGNEIKHTGDGIMAAFHSARGALDCAVAIQRALTAGDAVRVRIGLNAGEPVAEERDLYGTSVQLAARVCAEAGAGEILVSNVVRELAAGKGFLFSDRGGHALKGFEDPVRLYEVNWRE